MKDDLPRCPGETPEFNVTHLRDNPQMPDLTPADYDALYVVVKEQMPRVSREIFPKILEQLTDRGVIEITVTDEEVSLRMPQAPQLGVYRVERKRTLH